MAHMVETMAYAGETPWHGLGTKVPADLTPEQMLVAAGLDWDVKKVPCFTRLSGGKFHKIERHALVRSSDESILDVVSGTWESFQNAEAFDFFTDFIRAGDMEMHTAGSLRDGQIVWVLAKMKDKGFELFGGKDRVDGYMLLTNPHQFGKSIDGRLTSVRVVCNNTHTFALGKQADRAFKITHRKKFDAEKAKLALGIAQSKLDEYQAAAEFMSGKYFTSESLSEYFKFIFPVTGTNEDTKKEISLNAKRALDLVYKQPGAELGEGTFWQAYNTVTYMADHVLGRTAEGRLHNAWYGPMKGTKEKAMQHALELAKAA